jgi:hypothetical protein
LLLSEFILYDEVLSLAAEYTFNKYIPPKKITPADAIMIAITIFHFFMFFMLSFFSIYLKTRRTMDKTKRTGKGSIRLAVCLSALRIGKCWGNGFRYCILSP